jgi:uncharacterized Rmd1/YagE family protein
LKKEKMARRLFLICALIFFEIVELCKSFHSISGIQRFSFIKTRTSSFPQKHFGKVLSTGNDFHDKFDQSRDRESSDFNGRILNFQQHNKQINHRRGPLPRKQIKLNHEVKSVGRVSVYYVGSSIDLKGFRAHIFRKKFGGGDEDLKITKQNQNFDEYVHLWNSPICITSDKDPEDRDEVLKNHVHVSHLEHNQVQVHSPEGENSEYKEEDLDWKTKQMVALATQDVFYFQYGCVVFWGLTATEESTALAELAPFIKEPVNSEDLEERFVFSSVSFLFNFI